MWDRSRVQREVPTAYAPCAHGQLHGVSKQSQRPWDLSKVSGDREGGGVGRGGVGGVGMKDNKAAVQNREMVVIWAPAKAQDRECGCLGRWRPRHTGGYTEGSSVKVKEPGLNPQQ